MGHVYSQIQFLLKKVEPIKGILYFLFLFLFFEFLWKLCVHEGDTESQLFVLGFDLTSSIYPVCTATARIVYWIIHDLKRSEAVVYNKKEWVITDLSLERPFEFLKEEKKYQELWKEYYVSASIKSRVNLKAQKNYMPVRYWKHLIEKKV